MRRLFRLSKSKLIPQPGSRPWRCPPIKPTAQQKKDTKESKVHARTKADLRRTTEDHRTQQSHQGGGLR